MMLLFLDFFMPLFLNFHGWTKIEEKEQVEALYAQLASRGVGLVQLHRALRLA